MPFSAAIVQKAIEMAGYNLLSVRSSHVESLGIFVSQSIHNDPFDHMLLAVSRAEGLVLLTRNSNILQYKNALLESL